MANDISVSGVVDQDVDETAVVFNSLREVADGLPVGEVDAMGGEGTAVLGGAALCLAAGFFMCALTPMLSAPASARASTPQPPSG
ncbi:hypothetical protein [Streptomyces sp. NPDC002853]